MEESWFFITGKSPALSEEELVAQQQQFGYGSLSRVSEHCFEIKGGKLDIESLNRLGGVTKVGKVFATSGDDLVSTIAEYISSNNCSRYDFGVSLYDCEINTREATEFGIKIKKEIKKIGKPVRAFIPNTGTALPSAVVSKQLLGKGGIEIVAVKIRGGWLLGETKWVHQFEDWSDREYGKSAVDKKRGMIPHKLARIMLNLSKLPLNKNVTVYDPFCGTGVILLEARELNCEVLGSDLDPVAIEQSRLNLHIKSNDPTLWVSDARFTLIPKVNGRLVIVTEPYLGPVWNFNPKYDEVNVAIMELVRLYSDSLKNWRKQIPRGTEVVMIFPIIFGHSTYNRIVDTLTILGYSTNAGPLLYERSDQKVRRNIVKLVAV